MKQILGHFWWLIVKIKMIFPASHYALLALLFMVGLELIFALQQWVIWMAIAVVALVIIGVIIVRYEEEEETFKAHQTILPIIATMGLSGFAFFLPTSWILHGYILGSGFILFVLLKHGVRQAYPLWHWVISLVIYFLGIGFVLGLRFNLYWPVTVTLGLVMVISVAMTWQAMRRTVASGAQVIVAVLVASMVLAEVAWMMQFLPAHYLVQGSVMTTLYYVMLSLLNISYTRLPSRRDYLEYLGVGVLSLLIIVLSARWV